MDMRRSTPRPAHRVLSRAVMLALGSIAAFSAQAQQAAAPEEKKEESVTLETVQVTAQKRQENLQEVPLSLQVLDTQTLEEANVSDFEDYAKLLPAVSFATGEGGTPTPYFRGVVSGGDGNHSASSPSVGVYLDEQPVTTIGGALDVHIYDIERVEALAGPQGTLYGASSQSGTLKIVTNKPDPSGFAAGYALEWNSVSGGGDGFTAETYLNIPLADTAAIRLVAWHNQEAGYIDNVFGTRTFPSSGITIDNATVAEKDYNDVTVSGLRAALLLDLSEDWSILPSFMMQSREANGSFASDPAVGDLQITRFYPESLEDRWVQAALTVNGKIGDFDLTFAYSHLDRDINSQSDYSDYGFWYDTVAGYGAYTCSDFDPVAFECAPGTLINPSQYILGKDEYIKNSYELRIASPQDNRLRFIGGFFMQDQFHDIEQRYKIDGLSAVQSVTGWPDTIWLTKQERRDKDTALFGELSFDFTDALIGTLGFRSFRTDNSLKGFFGFADWGWVSSYGEAVCAPGAPTFNGAPCSFFDKTVKESDTLGKANLTWKFADNKMAYVTWSEGYRPAGLNRRGTLPPYLADFLTNTEVGWKTTWLENRLAFNGALFRQSWDDFQFPILGQNGLTEIKNANQARIDGLEMDLRWRATYNLTLTAAVGFYDAKLTANYCGFTDVNGNPVTNCPAPEAAEGTRLPVTAEFKGSASARYEWDWGDWQPFMQLAWVHEGKRTSDLRTDVNDIIGNMPAYDLFDLSMGFGKDDWDLTLYVKNLTDERAQFNRFTVCSEFVCGDQVYTVNGTPRTIGLRFQRDF